MTIAEIRCVEFAARYSPTSWKKCNARFCEREKFKREKNFAPEILINQRNYQLIINTKSDEFFLKNQLIQRILLRFSQTVKMSYPFP